MRSASVKLVGSKLPRDTRITAVPVARRRVQELLRQRRADAADKETRPRPPGRLGNPAADAAVLASAERQPGERGYAGMSPESAAAAAAGTTAPALRRRYQTRLRLATAVTDSLRVQPLPEPRGLLAPMQRKS